MAGTVLLSGSHGLATSTVEFDYFVERIRKGFLPQEARIAAAVYEPLDEGGMTFISVADLDSDSYQFFARAVRRAYKRSMREVSFQNHKDRWLELLRMIDDDFRSTSAAG